MFNGNPSSVTFMNFFEDWMNRKRFILNDLLSARGRLSQDGYRRLVTRMMSHYQRYYEEKSRATRIDVFVMFSPRWFSTYEQTFLWIAGFKPGIPFRILNRTVTDLSGEQLRRINILKAETRVREKELSNELAKVQEGVATSYLMEIAGGLVTGGMSADILRMTIVREIVEILSPAQSIDFLVAAAQLHIRIRAMGLEKDASRNNINGRI
ncbi:hypothetical protein AQUCO_04500118v1 [Aquilegia coerulea]|uniref:DOG1 domain-containing protein n=1 Tax=Aquilegia coerulea TaxID=218851 RepID=A0A2G5CLY5_AQUCA|nr:hypothetical protein AQUCO_04500118v1 [Aquilegia coerulea]